MNKQVAMLKIQSNLYRFMVELSQGGINIPFDDKIGYRVVVYKEYDGEQFKIEVMEGTDHLFILNVFDTEEEAFSWLLDGRKSTRSIKASIKCHFEGGRLMFSKNILAGEYDALVEAGSLDGEVLDQVRNHEFEVDEGHSILTKLPHHKAVAMISKLHDEIRRAMHRGGANFIITEELGTTTYHPDGTQSSDITFEMRWDRAWGRG
ncbi:MAG: hypothetical protein ACRCUJ_12935 [Phocaeicola sp.]